jgi:hypothetical protein
MQMARKLLLMRQRTEVRMELKLEPKEKELLKRELIRKLEATIRQAETADAALNYN